jgi:gamma-glutamyltranspeptidase/glutathione hydrolase
MGLNGVIATPHYLASAAGLRVLQDGGNALDAAIAANAVLGVVWPFMCGIGGDMFIVIYPAGGDRPMVLNASGRAGTRGTADFVRSAGFEKGLPNKGPLSVVVPGCVAGWQMALERYGTRELGALLQPAISFAENGYPVSPRLSEGIQSQARNFNDAARACFMPNGSAPRVGTIQRMPQYAESLKLIARDGPKAMYGGPLGQAIGDFLDSVGGHIVADDVAAHACDWVEPVAFDAYGHRVCVAPPNSQAILHAMSIALLDGFDLGSPQSAQATHLQVEAMKVAYQDRPRIADPAFVDVPLAEMVSEEHLRAGRASIDPTRASRPAVGATAGDTIYLCAADRDGTMVSLIQSLREPFGSGLMVPGVGIMLNDRAKDFGIADGDPNQIAPGKRPRHSLTPAMALKNGKPAFAYGTSGGDGQPYTVLQLHTNLLAFGMDPQEALDAPRWTIDPAPAGPAKGSIAFEDRVSQETLDGLAALGHPVKTVEGFSDDCGRASVVQIDYERGILLGGADPRSDGAALAW